MDCDAASAAGDDPMDFAWTAGWEASAAARASPDAPQPPPAPASSSSPQEEAESMILASGPRVAVAGLRRADCRAGAVLPPHVLVSWLLLCAFPGTVSSYFRGLASPAGCRGLGSSDPCTYCCYGGSNCSSVIGSGR
jgi:hypothetical protein